MLIQNYGLYWRRDLIHWGKGRNKGHLKGSRAGGKKSDIVDFRNQVGIYVLYDESFSVVYAGQAGKGNQRLFHRLGQHRKDRLADRWSRFSWFGHCWVTNGNTLSQKNKSIHANLTDVLNHIEGILIEAVEPPRNRQGGIFGDKVRQYLQYEDETVIRRQVAETLERLEKNSLGVLKRKVSDMTFTKKQIDVVWNLAQKVRGQDPDKVRQDPYGNKINRASYDKTTATGWEVDHINPAARGGSDATRNLQALKTSVNRAKGDSLVKKNRHSK